jgi:hypothetical protein
VLKSIVNAFKSTAFQKLQREINIFQISLSMSNGSTICFGQKTLLAEPSGVSRCNRKGMLSFQM